MKNYRQSTTALLSILFGVLALTGNAFATEKVVASGSWVKKAQAISGTWQIVDDGTKARIKFSGFKTKKAPDLKVFLHPKALTDVTAKNILNFGADLT